jgi:lysophospholipid acyltransferase (LPLAT)-like uncharacterized protein
MSDDAPTASPWWLPPLRGVLTLLLRTVRFEQRGAAGLRALLAQGKPFVAVFWHGSMLAGWWLLRGRGAASLVSRSRDGQILTDLLTAWGYRAIRGSSSRGGKDAMEAMRGAVAEGRILCVTPDGPRGPSREMKMGAVRVAQTMGVPFVAVAASYRRHRVLQSWDRFEVPWPFTRGVVSVAEPRTIDPSLSGDALEEMRRALEADLVALDAQVHRDCGSPEAA